MCTLIQRLDIDAHTITVRTRLEQVGMKIAHIGM